MVVLVCKVGIGWPPSCGVELGFSIALSSQISSQFSESSLPGDITIGSSPSEADITISVDKDNGNLSQLVTAIVLAAKSSAFEVRPIEIPTGVIYITHSLLFFAMKLAKSEV